MGPGCNPADGTSRGGSIPPHPTKEAEMEKELKEQIKQAVGVWALAVVMMFAGYWMGRTRPACDCTLGHVGVPEDCPRHGRETP